MNTSISYVTGNAANPIGEGNKIIVHVCSNSGHWGAGFAADLDYRWFAPQVAYQHQHILLDTDELMEFGTIHVVKVEHDIWVANLIGQHRTGGHNVAVRPFRYEAVTTGLNRLAAFAISRNASVHMPRIGCGLAGGEWSQTEPLIQHTLCNRGIQVFVYDPPGH